MIGLVLIVVLSLLAPSCAEVIAPHSPDTSSSRQTSWRRRRGSDGGNSRFLLGTDPVGRDILSRLIYGSRLSLLIGVIVVAISLSPGRRARAVAGYFRGWVETSIMRLMDVMLALPSLLLALAVVTILGPGLINAMFAIAITLQPYYARLTRAAVMAETSQANTSPRRGSPAPATSG